MPTDEEIAAEKAKTEGAAERKFTQADMDLAMAKVRRDEKRKADAKIAEADKLAAEVQKFNDKPGVFYFELGDCLEERRPEVLHGQGTQRGRVRANPRIAEPLDIGA